MKSKSLKTTGQIALEMVFVAVLFPFVIFSQSVSSVNCSDCASMPKPIIVPQPLYPQKAKKDAISGKVEVRIVIGENGHVIEASAQSGNEILREAAEAAAMKAKFTPAMSIGTPKRPLKVFGQITYNFVLDEKPPLREPVITASRLVIPKFYGCNCKISDRESVIVQFNINKEGKVDRAFGLTGHLFVRELSRKALLQSKFTIVDPGTRLGPQTGYITYDFRRTKSRWKVVIRQYRFGAE